MTKIYILIGETDELLSRFERFSFAISEIHRYVVKISSDVMSKYGLHGTSARFIIALYRNKDGLTASEICKVCDKNKAEVSRTLTSLIEKKLIKKEEIASKYRATITLTEYGRSAAKEIIELSERAVELGGNGLSEQEREALYSALDLVASNLQKMSAEGISRNQ